MKKFLEYKNSVWFDVAKPTEEDIAPLKKRFRIHPLTAKTIIPSIHYPDLDVFKNYLFMILHYPHCNDSGEIKIREFDIIAGPDYLVTTHHEDIAPVEEIFNICDGSPAKKEEVMSKGTGYLLFLILNAFLKDALAKSNRIAQDIDKLEAKIFSGQEREMVREISALKMQIIDMWRIVEPQRLVFDSLRNSGTAFFGMEYKHYFAILFRTHRRIENSLKSAKETVEALEATNHILVSVKMNEIIKVLTVFSVIFLPLTLLASVWGMNTNFLPFRETSRDFIYIILIMTVTLGAMLSYFRHKKWI